MGGMAQAATTQMSLNQPELLALLGNLSYQTAGATNDHEGAPKRSGGTTTDPLATATSNAPAVRTPGARGACGLGEHCDERC
jgi:hypothetical protein